MKQEEPKKLIPKAQDQKKELIKVKVKEKENKLFNKVNILK